MGTIFVNPGMTKFSEPIGPFHRPLPSVHITDDCISLPNNPDMQGFVVRLSLFISQACYVILLYFSEEDDKMIISSILLQSYGILVCSLVFLLRNKLSPDDVDFAIAAVHSPAFHWLLFENILSFKFNVPRFRKFGFLRIPLQILFLGVIPLWVAVSSITWLNLSVLDHRAKQNCAVRYSPGSLVVKLCMDIFWPYHGLLVVVIFRKSYQIPKVHPGWSLLIATMGTLAIAAVLGVLLLGITISWKILGGVVLIVWGFTLRVYHPEADYDFQYGQMVAIIPCIPPLYSVGKLVWNRLSDLGGIFGPVLDSICIFLSAIAIVVSPGSRTSFFYSLFRRPMGNVEIPLRRVGEVPGPSQAQDDI